MLPEAIYQIDDGTTEDSIGLTAGGDIICLNEFTVVPGSETITSISIAWGSPLFPDPTLNGLPYTAVLWSDPNGDGSPSDARVLATAPGVISDAGTDTFLTTSITPRTPVGNFFAGFIIHNAVNQFPAGFDETDPTLPDRSFVTGDSTTKGGDIYNLNNNELPVGTIESYGLVGNWLIRAEGTTVPLQFEAAASEITQGSETYDIDLPLTGPAGIECRGGIPDSGPQNYKWVFSFSQPIVSVDSADVSCGSVEQVVIESGNRVSLYTDLNGCTGSYVTATLNGVHSSAETLAAVSATMGLLIGDVDGDGEVRRSDYLEVRDLGKQDVTFSTFRDDVNANGRINSRDANAVRQHLGQSLPPQ